VVAGVAAADGRAYTVSVAGRIVCLDPASGRELWRHELGRPGVEPHVFAAPVVSGGRLYVAAEMTTGQIGVVTVFCFQLPGASP
jgi:outer membrane protein assembly factor BamB